jgi:N-acetylglucosamine-6-phosphate deacetylase
MTTGTYIIPTAIYVEKSLDTSHAVHVMDDRAHLVPCGSVPSDASVVKIDGIVTPGFLDLQVNGGGGVLFNDDPSPQAIDHIHDTHARYGTIGILPTVITDAPDVIDRAADAVIAHGQTDHVLGIHIEGPHISQGRRGTHSSELIRPFDERTFATLYRLRDANITTKLTLAPEVVDPEIIHRITQLDVIVSIGHTVASNAQTWAAIDAGASCATHLMNAMPPLTNRDPGPVVAIMNAGLACGIICDGIHVQDEMIKLALRAHAHPDRIFLVSDSMPTIGGPDQFDLYDMTVRLTEGQLINSEGYLAGAHITQAEGVARLVNAIGLNVVDALHMAIDAPANMVGRSDLAKVDGRALGDLVVLSNCAQQTSVLHAILKKEWAGEPT